MFLLPSIQDFIDDKTPDSIEFCLLVCLTNGDGDPYAIQQMRSILGLPWYLVDSSVPAWMFDEDYWYKLAKDPDVDDICVNPLFAASLFLHVSQTIINRFADQISQKYCFTDKSGALLLAKVVRCFRKNLSKGNTFSEREYQRMMESRYIQAVLVWMAFLSGKTNFLSSLPSDVLVAFWDQFVTVFRREPIVLAANLRENLKSFLLDKEKEGVLHAAEITPSQFFLFYIDCFNGANLHKISAEVVAQIPAYFFLSLFYTFGGHYKEAVATIQKACKEISNKRVVDDPFLNTFLGIYLLLGKQEPSLFKKAVSLASLKQTKIPRDGGMLFELCSRITDTESSEWDSAVRNYLQGFNPESFSFWRALLCTKLRPESTQRDKLKSYADAPELPMFFRREADAVLNPEKYENGETTFSYANKTCDFGVPPLMSLIKVQAEWERVIERIIQIQNSRTRRPDTEDSERFVYEVDKDTLEIWPRLQKRTKNGSWTSGKSLTLSAFKKSTSPSGPVENALRNLVEGGERFVSSRLGGAEAMSHLIGYPYVYRLDTDLSQRIEVCKGSLELSFTKNKNGEIVPHHNLENFSQAALLTYDYLSVWESPEVLKIYHLSHEEQQILGQLNKVKSFPARSVKPLTQMIKEISTDIPVLSDLVSDKEMKPTAKAVSKITFQFSPTDYNCYSVHAVVRPVPGSTMAFEPGHGLQFVTVNVNKEPVSVCRDLKKEKTNWEEIENKLLSFSDYQENSDTWILNTEQVLEFMEVLRENKGICDIAWPQEVKFKVDKPPITFDSINLNIRSIGSWLTMQGKVQLDGKTALEMDELLDKIREAKGRFIKLDDTEYVAISDKLKKVLSQIAKVTHKKKKELEISAFNAGSLKELEDAGVSLNADQEYRDLLSRIDSANNLNVSVPSALQAELRSYQIDGFEWLARLAHWGAGAILADDMGLGKTIQTITLLLFRASQGPSLVVTPSSVLYNWRDEISRFAPSLNIHIFNSGDRKKILETAGNNDVVLCTYGVLSSEIENMSKPVWNVVVLDEAHAIKNRTSQISKNVHSLKSKARVLLTGTPIQNHLSEIWNLFDFANPGLLGSLPDFSERFIIPIEKYQDKDQQRLLKKMISPFLLRRTKAEVLEELPQKTEITIKVSMSPEETALYENLRNNTLENLASGEINSIQAMAALTKLRQAACNPKLVDAKLDIPSSKASVFLELVKDLIANNHRALVFSQFTSHLALIKQVLDEAKIEYLYLDGSTPTSERKGLVEKFQTGLTPIFLISLKAGGLGLNLTGADYVIHLDPWWNPAIEDQASDRAYRIGQERAVTIYRLITENTIEEKIIDLHLTKRSLADALLEGADMSSKLSKEEILKLLSV